MKAIIRSIRHLSVTSAKGDPQNDWKHPLVRCSPLPNLSLSCYDRTTTRPEAWPSCVQCTLTVDATDTIIPRQGDTHTHQEEPQKWCAYTFHSKHQTQWAMMLGDEDTMIYMGVVLNSFIRDPSFSSNKNTLAKLSPSCVLSFAEVCCIYVCHVCCVLFTSMASSLLANTK